MRFKLVRCATAAASVLLPVPGVPVMRMLMGLRAMLAAAGPEDNCAVDAFSQVACGHAPPVAAATCAIH